VAWVRFAFNKELRDVDESEIRALFKPQFNGFFFFCGFIVACSVAGRYHDIFFYVSSFLKALKPSSGLRRTDRRASVLIFPAV